MKKEILSEEINAMKYLLGYKRGVVISEQVAPTTGTTASPAAAPAAQKFNFNPNPNITPESGINLKMQTPQDLAKGVASATPATPAPAAPAPATNLSTPDLIKQIQTILKTRFNAMLGTGGPNKDGVDGVWGKNTQTAFENALKAIGSQAAAAPAAAAPTTGTPAAGAPVSGATSTTQQKFNFNPNPNLNLNPESGINFKPSTPKL
jgi:hypothetical protein